MNRFLPITLLAAALLGVFLLCFPVYNRDSNNTAPGAERLEPVKGSVVEVVPAENMLACAFKATNAPSCWQHIFVQTNAGKREDLCVDRMPFWIGALVSDKQLLALQNQNVDAWVDPDYQRPAARTGKKLPPGCKQVFELHAGEKTVFDYATAHNNIATSASTALGLMLLSALLFLIILQLARVQKRWRM